MIDYNRIIYIGDNQSLNTEHNKSAIFTEVKQLLAHEGYLLRDDLDAIHLEEDEESFKQRYSKNGWNNRTIRNIEGWIVLIRYRRYKTAQKNGIKGVELERCFDDLLPVKKGYDSKIKNRVIELYNSGYRLHEIKISFDDAVIEITNSTLKNWTKGLNRKNRIDLKI